MTEKKKRQPRNHWKYADGTGIHVHAYPSRLIYKRLKEEAARRRIPASEVCRQILDRYLPEEAAGGGKKRLARQKKDRDSVETNINLSPAIFARLEGYERAEGISRSRIISELLDRHLPPTNDEMKREQELLADVEITEIERADFKNMSWDDFMDWIKKGRARIDAMAERTKGRGTFPAGKGQDG